MISSYNTSQKARKSRNTRDETMKKKGHLAVKIVLVLAVICVVAAGVGYWVFKTQFYDQTNYVKKGTYGTSGFSAEDMIAAGKVASQTARIGSQETEDASEAVSEATLSSEDEEKLIAEQQEALLNTADQMFSTKNTYNILLLGVDRRDESWNGNSDVVMLVTVNMDKQKIYMTSFLRDLYVNIPDIGVRKLNAACANGGPELAVQTLEENYQVQIDNYAMVDFNAMIDVIDALGGIELEIDEDERVTANDYITCMCQDNEVDPEPYYIKEAGLVHLSGYQAVGYARNRYTGKGSDFGRTQRQRNVMTAILKKVQSGSYDSLTDVVKSIMPYITHDITEMEMIGILLKLNTWIGYDTVEQHIPYNDEYYTDNEILIPNDMSDTITKLNGLLYGDLEISETEGQSETETESEAEV